MNIPNNPEVDAALSQKPTHITVSEMFPLTGPKYRMEQMDDALGYRIIAMRGIPRHGVKKGDEGGVIQKPYNLSQDDDDSWIHASSRALENARVSGDAYLGPWATMTGNARLRDRAKASFTAMYDCADVSGTAEVEGTVKQWAQLYGRCHISADSKVIGPVAIGQYAHLHGATVEGGKIYGNARLKWGAYIKDESDWLVVNNVGSENSFLTAYPNKDGVICVNRGCFCDTLPYFEEAVRMKHGPDTLFYKQYQAIIALIKIHFAKYLEQGQQS